MFCDFGKVGYYFGFLRFFIFWYSSVNVFEEKGMVVVIGLLVCKVLGSLLVFKRGGVVGLKGKR